MTQAIIITIAPDGQTLVETIGYSGESCRTASQFLEQALGKPQQEQLKPEFYATNEVQQRLQEDA